MSEKNMLLPLAQLTEEERKWLCYWAWTRTADMPIQELFLMKRSQIKGMMHHWNFEKEGGLWAGHQRIKEKVLKAIASCA